MKFDYDFMIWSDSFKEGEWIIELLLHEHFILEKVEFRYNFQPVYYLKTNGKIIRFVIYGGYSSWTNKPQIIERFLEISRPDIMIYNAKSNKIILAIEETAAVPTGNQSLQRLERVWWAAELGIPFVYLIPEYGIHKDGGKRKNSIWPAYLGLKLSAQYKIPSLTILFGDKDHPEDYDFGTIKFLENLTNLFILKQMDIDVDGRIEELLFSIFKEMSKFILSQKGRICDILPGCDIIDNKVFIESLIEGFRNG